MKKKISIKEEKYINYLPGKEYPYKVLINENVLKWNFFLNGIEKKINFCKICSMPYTGEPYNCCNCGNVFWESFSKYEKYCKKKGYDKNNVIIKNINKNSLNNINKYYIPSKSWKRFLNLIIDSIILILLFFVLIYSEHTPNLLINLLWFLYYFLFESLLGKTPGKYITKTEVVDFYGNKPSFERIFIRTILRFIPIDIITYLGPSRPIGFHDSFSKTITIDSVLKSNK